MGVVFTAVDHSGSRVLDKITNIPIEDTSLLSEKGQALIKKTVVTIATWHLQKALLEGFAGHEGTLVYFLVFFFKEFGETKFEAVLKKATSTRTSTLSSMKVEALKAIATAHRKEGGEEKFNEACGGCLSGARKDNKFSEKTLNSVGKNQLVEIIIRYEQFEDESIVQAAEKAAGGVEVEDEVDNDVLKEAIRTNFEFEARREKLVKAMKPFEGDKTSDAKQEVDALARAKKNFLAMEDQGLTEEMLEKFNEIMNNVEKCEARIAGGAEFTLTAEAKKKFAINYTRLLHILTMIYEAALLEEPAARKEIIVSFLENGQQVEEVTEKVISEYNNDDTKFEIAFAYVETKVSLVQSQSPFEPLRSLTLWKNPAVAFQFRCTYCDLRLAIQPFRDLHEGYLQTLVDNLPRMGATLLTYGKPEIFSDVITSIGNNLHMTRKIPKLWHYYGENHKAVAHNDQTQEFVNAQMNHLVESSGYNTTQAILKEASSLRSFGSILKELSNDIYEGQTVDKERKRPCELDLLSLRYKGQQFKATIDIFQQVMRDLRKKSWDLKGVKFPNKVQEGFNFMADNDYNSVDVVKRKVTGWVEKDGQKLGPAPEVRALELERRVNEKATKALKKKKKRKFDKDEVVQKDNDQRVENGGRARQKTSRYTDGADLMYVDEVTKNRKL